MLCQPVSQRAPPDKRGQCIIWGYLFLFTVCPFVTTYRNTKPRTVCVIWTAHIGVSNVDIHRYLCPAHTPTSSNPVILDKEMIIPFGLKHTQKNIVFLCTARQVEFSVRTWLKTKGYTQRKYELLKYRGDDQAQISNPTISKQNLALPWGFCPGTLVLGQFTDFLSTLLFVYMSS